MMTRDVTSDIGYKATCQHAPPPLHVADTQAADAQWYPLRRPPMAPHHPGPIMATIPMNRADLFGDDPTDPSACTEPRQATAGMISRLNVNAGERNVGHSGVRR